LRACNDSTNSTQKWKDNHNPTPPTVPRLTPESYTGDVAERLPFGEEISPSFPLGESSKGFGRGFKPIQVCLSPRCFAPSVYEFACVSDVCVSLMYVCLCVWASVCSFRSLALCFSRVLCQKEGAVGESPSPSLVSPSGVCVCVCARACMYVRVCMCVCSCMSVCAGGVFCLFWPVRRPYCHGSPRPQRV